MWGYSNESVQPNEFIYSFMCHIDDDVDTLYYQFQDYSDIQTSVTWSTYVGEDIGEEIKLAYEESMMKWNNVYYYKLNENGLYENIKRRLL